MKTNKPLEGVRVLAVSQYGAGPYGTLHLADLGAEVIKIEDRSLNGDVSRSVTPYAADGDSLYFQSLNRNKKSITLNLKSDKGQELFRRLVKKSDVVFNNLRGDVPQKLGLQYEALKEVNPEIVTCSLSGFGTRGSMRSEPAYDYLLQAMLGHMSLTGDPEGPPEKYGVSMIDFSTGIMAAFAIMAGLFQAKTQGRGCDLDVSLFDTSASLLNYLAVWALNRDFTPGKTKHSAHPTLVPSQMFQTKDGYLVVMCNKEKFFPLLCEIMNLPEVAADPRYRDFPARFENKASLVDKLSEVFKRDKTATWLEKFRGKIPAAPVQTVQEALKHPLLAERDMIVQIDHPQLGVLKAMGTPVKFLGFKPTYKAAPTLGEHNEEILGGLLGIDSETLKELENQKVI